MVQRLFFAIFALLLVCPPASGQRQQQAETHADTYVNVTYENDHPVSQTYRVQILTNGLPRDVQFTNDLGQVTFRGLAVGSYRLVVTGPDIEKAEAAFAIYPREFSHYEFIRVKMKSVDKSNASSSQGTVSAATLNIPDKARKEFDKGIAAFNKQDFQVAREHFTKATEIYPQYSLAFVNLGVIVMKVTQNKEGQEYFKRAIAADPQNASGYTFLARVNITHGDFSQAETLLAKAIAITPLDPEPLTMLATSEFRLGKLDLALANAKKVHTVPHEHFAVSHLIAAQVLMQEKSPDMAAEEYKLYLKESPNGPSAVSVRAALQSIENRSK